MIDEEGKRLWERVCETVRDWRKSMTPAEWRAQYIGEWEYESATLDLHGMTVEEAYRAVRAFINASTLREVTVITGLSGQIREEFPQWIELSSRVRNSQMLNGGGAFRLTLR